MSGRRLDDARGNEPLEDARQRPLARAERFGHPRLSDGSSGNLGRREDPLGIEMENDSMRKLDGVLSGKVIGANRLGWKLRPRQLGSHGPVADPRRDSLA